MRTAFITSLPRPQLFAVLAGLSYLESRDYIPPAIQSIANEDGAIEPLEPSKIERLFTQLRDANKTSDKKSETTENLSRPAVGAVLAGLRFLQAANPPPPDINDTATDNGAFEPLSAQQIDDLCMQINQQSGVT